MDRIWQYDIIYALAANEGREAALFGDCASAAHDAFSRSLAGEAFPEIWFEIPLTGDPWLDLHVLISHEDVVGTRPAFSGQSAIYADALTWFADQQQGTVRQLALSYDTHTGDIDNPAVQLLVGKKNANVPLGFLDAIGRQDAKGAYQAFVENIPEEWYACYLGTFPQRQTSGGQPWVRVECIVGDKLQQVYADDVAPLRDHLARVGMTEFGDGALEGIQKFARSPFALELQFDVGAQGKAQPVISASVRFDSEHWIDSSFRENIIDLFDKVQEWGLADARCKQLADTLFAKRIAHEDEIASIFCLPAFVKLRWQVDRPACAKAYMLARSR